MSVSHILVPCSVSFLTFALVDAAEWSESTSNSGFFKAAAPATSRADAAAYCSANGASLASILNQEDFDAAMDACAGDLCWIGLKEADFGARWQWDDEAPLTDFGFDENANPTNIGFFSVTPWHSGNPFEYVWGSQWVDGNGDICVCMSGNGRPNTGFLSARCDTISNANADANVATPLCRKTTFKLMLQQRNSSKGCFSPSLLSTGTENGDDSSGNTFSVIGLQDDDGDALRGLDGAFYFKLDYRYRTSLWTPAFYYKMTIFWKQTSWLTETTRSGLTVFSLSSEDPAFASNSLSYWLSQYDFDGLGRNGDEGYAYLTGDSESATSFVGKVAPCATDVPAMPLGATSFPTEYTLPIFPNMHAFNQSLYVYYVGGASSTSESTAQISVTGCPGWTTPASGSGQMSIMLHGTNGTTPFISINGASDLPMDGETATFDISTPLKVGTVLSASLYMNDAAGYCIKAISVVSSSTTCGGDEAGACNFGADYFGRGMVLASRGSCAATFIDVLGGDDDPMLPCFDQGFLDLQPGSSRGIVDLSIHSCNLENGGISASSGSNLSVVLTGKESISTAFVISDAVPLRFSDYWQVDTTRHLEINVDVPLASMTLAQLVNHGVDDLCVDVMFADGLPSVHFSGGWIGTGPDADSTIATAVFKYPVCDTEVKGITVDKNYSTVQVTSDETITGLDCSNHNRILTSTCSISQSYEMSKSTAFAFAEETERTSEYAWGHESSSFDETTVGSSTSQSDSFAWGLSQEVTVGVEVGGDAAGYTASASVSLTAHQEWTETSERSSSTESTSGSSWGSNEEWSQSTGSTSSNENSWESSQTTTISCEGSMDVPPSHSVSYSLVFNTVRATIRTYTDMKVTLCSALLGGEDEDEAADDERVYIDRIPGTIEYEETTACEVHFEPAQYIPNDVGCAEEEKLAIAAGATYIPRCQSGDSSFYEPCQCDIGDSRTMGVCWCSDEKGNPSDTKVYQFSDESDADVCAALACTSGHNALVQQELGDDDELQDELDGEASEPLVDVELLNNLLSLWPMLNNLLMVAFATLAIASGAIAVYFGSKCWLWISHGKSRSDEMKLADVVAPTTKTVIKEQELTVVTEAEQSRETV